MKKLLAAVLAVALVAVVYVGVNHAPAAPVAEDDAVVAADVTAPAEDEAPAQDVKTAVLGSDVVTYVNPEETITPGDDDVDESSSDEPSSDEPSSDEPSSDEPSSDEPSSDEPSDDTTTAKLNPHSKADVIPKDDVTIDSDGDTNNTSVSIYASNSGGDIEFNSGDMYVSLGD